MCKQDRSTSEDQKKDPKEDIEEFREEFIVSQHGGQEKKNTKKNNLLPYLMSFNYMETDGFASCS